MARKDNNLVILNKTGNFWELHRKKSNTSIFYYHLKRKTKLTKVKIGLKGFVTGIDQPWLKIPSIHFGHSDNISNVLPFLNYILFHSIYNICDILWHRW